MQLCSHIIQGISMTVKRENAASTMGTLGPQRSLEDFFDVISTREENHNFILLYFILYLN